MPVSRALFAKIVEKAERGDVECLYRVGYCYFNGDGVEEDCEQALVCWRLASDKGNGKAYYRLAWCFEEGAANVVSDKEEARFYYRLAVPLLQNQAVNKADDEAQYLLATCFYLGHGVTQPDIRKALYWYRAAAVQGNGAAQFWMGRFYWTGVDEISMSSDYIQSMDWYSKSALQGYSQAKKILTHRIQELNTAVASSSSSSAKEDAMRALAHCYHHGIGVAPDSNFAREWLREADFRSSEAEEDDASKVCVCCQEKPARVTLVHGRTGHTCCCLTCAYTCEVRGMPCPLCQQPIDTVIVQYGL